MNKQREHYKRMEERYKTLRSNTPPCPSCGATGAETIILFDYRELPATWKCKSCNHEFKMILCQQKTLENDEQTTKS
jgi:transcription elongation factor Elf1